MKRQEKLTWLCTRTGEGQLTVHVKRITPFPEGEESTVEVKPSDGPLERSKDPDEILVFPDQETLRLHNEELLRLNPSFRVKLLAPDSEASSIHVRGHQQRTPSS